MFFPGQRVRCVNAKDRGNGPTGLVYDETYTILREIDFGVLIHEVSPDPCMGFWDGRFRPAMVQKTNIRVTKKAPVKEDA